MKKILPFLLLIFMTGCTVDYNIKIKHNNIKEKISITEDISKVNEKISDYELENAYSEYNNNLKRKYNGFKEKKDDKITYNLTQDYSLTNKLYIRAFSECFDSYIFDISNENEYVIKTSSGFKCLSYNYNEIDSVNINISVDQKVIESNADSINNDTYTWNINSDNFKDKYIYIRYKNTIKESKNNKMNNIINKDILFVVLGFVCILAIFGIIVLITLNINKNKNKL